MSVKLTVFLAEAESNEVSVLDIGVRGPAWSTRRHRQAYWWRQEGLRTRRADDQFKSDLATERRPSDHRVSGSF